MKYLLFFVIALMFVRCDKSSVDDDIKKTLGYYNGMSRSDYEYITGQHIESGFFRPHWSKVSDKYSLSIYGYGDLITDNQGSYYTKMFYPSFTFKLYGDKLVSIKIEFNHGGTIWGNESRGLLKSEIDEVMTQVKKYFQSKEIDATFEVIPYSESFNGNDCFEIIGIVNL